MRVRTGIVVVLCVLVAATGCSAIKGTSSEPSPSPSPTAAPVPAGGTVSMGTAVKTKSGSTVTVFGWHMGANRTIAPGPHQVYESAEVQFCAGPGVRDTTNDLAPLFSLFLPNGSRIAPDSLSSDGEFRAKGTVNPGQCARGPIVFQVAGGAKPQFVVFESEPETKWTVQ